MNQPETYADIAGSLHRLRARLERIERVVTAGLGLALALLIGLALA